tara:strand:+ start:58 stop:933 length:876 start_codon:yes stop_codon:yes gene_type:complete
MFSIIIPTFNNLDYLKVCIDSIKKNSKYNHEIILHINCGSDGSLEYVKNNKYTYTYTKENVGLCTSVNLAAKKSSTKFIVYAHDDMYFCPGWDVAFEKEVKNSKNNLYLISGTMIEANSGHLQLNCGVEFSNFNEKKLLTEFNNIDYYDFQGTTWCPQLIHKETWEKVGGLSEEFNPGIGSDPDLNMKLWMFGVRVFKGLSDCRVYHFGSITLRKKKNFKRNRGSDIFLKKWGISIDFFLKYYLNGNYFKNNKIFTNEYLGPLNEPNKNLFFYINLIICKINLFYLNFFKS